MNRRNLIFMTITVLVAIGCVEAIAYVAIRLYLGREERLFHQSVPEFTDAEIQNLRAGGSPRGAVLC
jgi:hypothetical protein